MNALVPRSVYRMFLLLGVLLTCVIASQAQTEVNLQEEPKKSLRGGATLALEQTADGNGVKLTVDYPDGEGGGGAVWFKVDAFSGPLSHITFNAMGSLGYGRVGVRGSLKEASSVGMELPAVNAGMQAYSLDFTAAIEALEAGGQEFVYPITEVILGFRYKDNPQDVLEISDIVLHPVE